MNTETLNPSVKDANRLNYLRSARAQDHGTARNTFERYDPIGQERTRRFKEQVAKRALNDELASLTPSQLEKEADLMLAEAAIEHDALSDDVIENNNHFEDVVELEQSEEEATEAHENQGLNRINHMSSADQLRGEMRNRRRMQGRRGSTSSPDYLYNGTHGDDEDLADTTQPLGGYLIR